MPSGMWFYSYLALWTLLLLESALLLAVIRQIHNLHAYYIKNSLDEGLPLGALAPALSGNDVFGRPVSLAASRGKKTLIYFLSPSCGGCRTVMKIAKALNTMDGVELALVMGAKKVRVELFLAEHWHRSAAPPFPVLFDANQIMDRYKITMVPQAVIVDEDGRIGGKGSPMTISESGNLVRQAEQLRQRRLGHSEDEGLISLSSDRFRPPVRG